MTKEDLFLISLALTKQQEYLMEQKIKYVSEHRRYVKRLIYLVFILGIASQLEGLNLILNNHEFVGFCLAGILANLCMFYLFNITRFNAYKI